MILRDSFRERVPSNSDLICALSERLDLIMMVGAEQEREEERGSAMAIPDFSKLVIQTY